jgi:hypothetical protein
MNDDAYKRVSRRTVPSFRDNCTHNRNSLSTTFRQAETFGHRATDEAPPKITVASLTFR